MNNNITEEEKEAILSLSDSELGKLFTDLTKSTIKDLDSTTEAAKVANAIQSPSDRLIAWLPVYNQRIDAERLNSLQNFAFNELNRRELERKRKR